ncbi:conjugal transfer protein TraH [Pseudomonas aeruginosa]|uniref:conjugal transfer protein TraH n=1 Tax=Pseudomonas aeruginosa TaxID=287 RepID=UPI000AFC3B32|nr:conjugal transfer protein TraH [Pseudomonas aeruginosa]
MVSKFLPRRMTLAIGFAVAASALPGTSSANIQSQMDSMFESMSNTTGAGYFESATRGVISGGSMRVRNKIATDPIVSFRPPSFQAGCGGIDMFAGSFSFINAQQFVQSLRSVASNAVGVASGYAFKLALNAMGPTVHNVIQNLQEVMQDVNTMMSNSCQLAQGLVSDAFSAFNLKADMNASTENVSKGLGDVFSQLKPSNLTASNPKTEQAKAGNAAICKDYGNVLWCAMRQNNIKDAFQYGSNQTEELILSLVGSAVIGDLANADDGKGQERKLDFIKAKDISLKDIIEGKKDDKLTIYSCAGDTEYCSEPTNQEISFDGLAAKIVRAFNGGDNGPGIIYKWHTNTGSFTSSESEIIAALQQTSFSAMIQRLSQRSQSIAQGFVEEHARLIARDAVTALIRSYISAAESSMLNSKMTDLQGPQAAKFISEARKRLASDYSAVLKDYGNSKEVFEDYENKLKIMPATSFLAVGPATAPGGE